MRLISLVIFTGLLTVAAAWAEEPASDAAQKVTVGEVTCKQMMAGDDLDRGAVIMYFHGYRAGKMGQVVVDIPALSAQSDRVTDYCLSNPTVTVMDAFAKTSP